MPSWPSEAGLDYSDAGGEVTRRVVKVSRVTRHYDVLMLVGYCLLRKAPRNFRSDRMQDLFDPATGEMFPDIVEALEHHPAFQKDQIWSAEKPSNLPPDIEATLTALGYLASLTHARANEKVAIMFGYLDQVWKCLPAQRQTVEVYLHGLDPPYAEIGKGLSAAAADQACRKPFLDACWSMALLDGRVTDREKNFLKRVKIAFGKKGVTVAFEVPETAAPGPAPVNVASNTSASPSTAVGSRNGPRWLLALILIAALAIILAKFA